MDERGGQLRTVGRVDREEICSDEAEATGGTSVDDVSGSCSIRLDVAVQPMTHFHIFKVSPLLTT